MLVLAPAACCLAGLALSEVTSYLTTSLAVAQQAEQAVEAAAEAAAQGELAWLCWAPAWHGISGAHSVSARTVALCALHIRPASCLPPCPALPAICRA